MNVGSSSPPKSLPGAAGEETVATPRAMRGATLPGVDPEPPLGPGTRVGRYRLLEVVGRGGMGIVHTAHDPELDRIVAVKLVRPEAGGTRQSAGGRDRMLREARALAKLSHPNVIDVYDVGSFGDHLFLAMEYVHGSTLSVWLEARKAWPAILDVFIEAGRGLAAAHRAGLVHRDFKPTNVLIGEDGRARVLDFGLAAPVEQLSPGGIASTDAAVSRLTATGQVMGTPAYMSPEHHRGRAIDARSDQFAFCVALWEALYGERPFTGDNARELCQRMERAELRHPTQTNVPIRVHRVLVRGLAPNPSDRWPSMDEVLAQLERARRGDPRGRWATWGVLAVGLGAWGIVAALPSDAECTAGANDIAELWNDEHRERAHAAFERTSLPYAAETWKRVETSVDAYAEALVEARVDICRGKADDEDPWLDRRTACLQARQAELGGLVRVLQDADEDVVRRAVAAVGRLMPVSTCDDPEHLGDELSTVRAELAADVAAVRDQLALARALESSGKYPEALTTSDAAVERAVALGYAPLVAEARMRQGFVRERLADYEGARDSLQEAVWVATSVDYDRVVALSANELAYIAETSLQDEDASWWLRHGQTAVERLGNPPELRTHLLTTRGNIAWRRGDLPLGLASFEEALEIREAISGAEDLSTLTLVNNIALVHLESGDLQRARRGLEDCLELRRKLLGPRHPDVGATLGNLGAVMIDLEEIEAAIEYNTAALDIFEEALGPEHPHVARMLTNIGNGRQLQERYDEAVELYRQALPIFVAALGPDALQVGKAHNNIGAALHSQGRFEEAAASYREALALWERTLGPEHPELVSALTNLGQVAMAQERYDDALQWFARSVTVCEQAYGAEHVFSADAHHHHARALLELGRPGAAARELEGVLEAVASSDEHAELRGRARFELARARWTQGKHDDAMSLAEQSRPDLPEPDRQQLDDWLADHRPGGGT